MSDDADRATRTALMQAVGRIPADVDRALPLIAAVSPEWRGKALGYVIYKTALVWRLVQRGRGGAALSRRIAGLRRCSEALMAADADMPDKGYIGVPRDALAAAAAADLVPVAGVFGWIVCNRLAATYPEVAARAACEPMGLHDPAVRAWTTNKIAAVAGERWVMSLLASIGRTA